MWLHVSVFAVCLQHPGMGEDVKIDCIWIYGVISFENFCDLMV